MRPKGKEGGLENGQRQKNWAGSHLESPRRKTSQRKEVVCGAPVSTRARRADTEQKPIYMGPDGLV